MSSGTDRDDRNRGRRQDDRRVWSAHRFAQPEIRVIGEDDKPIGIMTTAEALQLAKDRGLDLVEISSHTVPPICKILDYGKYKYDTQKEANLRRKKQKVFVLKEVQMRHNIGAGDFETKMRKVREFLADGDRVKICVRLRGREMMNRNLAINILNKVIAEVAQVAKLEKEIVQNNNNFFTILAPNVQ